MFISYRILRPVHTMPERNLKTEQSPVILDLYLLKTSTGKSHDYPGAIVFEKFRAFWNVFRPRENEKLAFSIFSGLKGVFEKLRFGDGLVWMVGLTGEIKLRFEISPA